MYLTEPSKIEMGKCRSLPREPVCLGCATEREIPVVCLYRENTNQSLAPMIAGSPYITIVRYSEVKDLMSKLDNYL